MPELPIDSITIGSRGRADLGDLSELAASIEAVGLLHPVVVTAAHELVAGERRLAAMRELGRRAIPATVVDFATVGDALRAELEENTCRKALSAYEADVIRQRREEVLRPTAKERQGARTDLEPSTNLVEGSRRARETSQAAAIGTGYSGSTLDKVRVIRDVAERGVVRQGKTEMPASAPVVEVAREAAENIKQTGAAVESEHRRVRAAIEQHMAPDPELTNLRYRSAISSAISATRNNLLTLEPARVAAVVEDFSRLETLRTDLDAWFEAIHKAAAPPADVIPMRGARLMDVRHLSPDERSEHDDLMAEAGLHPQTGEVLPAHEIKTNMLRLIRDAQQAHKTWAGHLTDDALADGLHKHWKGWHDARTRIKVYDPVLNAIVPTRGQRGTRKRTDDGLIYHQRAFWEDMTWAQVNEQLDEIDARINAEKVTRRLAVKLMKLLTLAPQSATVGDACAQLGISMDEYLADEAA